MADSAPSAASGQANAPAGEAIARIVTINPKEGKNDELLAILFKVRKTAFATGQCTQYVVSQTADGSTITEVIGWTSQEGLETWAKESLGPQIAEYGVKDLLAGVASVDVLPVVEE